MKIGSLIFLVCSVLFTVSCASQKINLDEGAKQAQKAEAPKKMLAKKNAELGYTCLVAGDKRIVTLDKKDKRCEVHYTKFGKKERMAWGEKRLHICDDVFKNIKSNIEKRGFKCTTGLDSQKKERKTASAK